MAGIIFLVYFFLLGGGLIWMTHRALIAENARYGIPADPPPTRQERADVAPHQRAA